jgi:hypothetical protein
MTLVETAAAKAGFESRGQCQICGRFSEKLVGPLLRGMRVPSSDTVFFASQIANENVRVGYRPFFVSDKIVQALKKAKVGGVDFVPSI